MKEGNEKEAEALMKRFEEQHAEAKRVLESELEESLEKATKKGDVSEQGMGQLRTRTLLSVYG